MNVFFSGQKPVLLLFLLGYPFFISAQSLSADSLPGKITLQSAVKYAIQHQPVIQQSLIDERITEATIRSKLADWYPQLNFNYVLQHNFILQSSIFGGNVVKLGSDNTSSGLVTVSQAVFNRDVLLANRTKGDVRLQSRQLTESNKIDVAANVSKAFYDVLAASQQIKVASENIVRLERSLQDATNQYKYGITDKIDYKRATISLNNIRASKKSAEELTLAKTEYLKSLMGYPDSVELSIVYDSLEMERNIGLDTLQQPDYRTRIEYRLLETQRKLLQADVLYNKWSFLPSVAANGAYNFNYQNNRFNKLYYENYPNSFAALTIAFPLFQGGKRKANIRIAELELQRSDEDVINLKNTVNAQYAQALASYKSNLANYLAQKENVALAKEVYDVIQLQYRSGIKTYLEVITAETDLRTSQINYFNSLYQVLSARIDVQRAAGQLTY